MLSPGNADLYAQLDDIAIDAILSGALFQLRQQGQGVFTTSVGPVTLKLTLTELDVANIRAVNPADRFGGTLASFVIKGDLEITLPIVGTIVDHIEVDIDDLQVGVVVTPGGLPTGISLGFGRFSVQVKGLGFLTAFLNFILGLLSVVIRAVLAPIGLVPIMIYQMADVFARLGVFFKSGFPAIGPSLAGGGLVALADFQNTPAHASSLTPIVDLIGPGSALTVAGQMNQRLANTAVQIGMLKGYFPTAQNIGGITFYLTGLGFTFENPTAPFAAKIAGWATARGKIKKGCGFLGGLFSRVVKITVGMNAVADGAIAPKPAPATGSNLVFQFDATVRAKVSIPSIYGIVLSALLGPLLFLLLLLFVQILNIVAAAILPQTIAQITRSGATVTVTLRHLQLGTSLFSISARAQVGATGTIDLDQIVTLATARFPVHVTFPSDGLATQSLASSNNDGDLLLGARLTP